MAEQTTSKNEDNVSSIEWGTHTPTVEYKDSPTRTIYTREEAGTFTIRINHPSGSNPPSQDHTGKKIVCTLCDGNWTIQTS